MRLWSGRMSEPFCPICHPERLPTEARLTQPAHAGHIAIRFDDNAHWLTPFLDGQPLARKWVDEILCGDAGWALCRVLTPVADRPGRWHEELCLDHLEPMRRVLRGSVTVARDYEPGHAR